MRRILPALAVLAFLAWAANLKLYLKDGTYQLVREYQVQADRVRYYSIERSDWEEIPLDMVDLPRTRSEADQRQAEVEKQAKVVSEEENVERAVQNEASRIPQDPGVYWVEGGQTKTIKLAETSIHTKKGRSVLAWLSPIPMVSGKGTLELNGAHSLNVFSNPEQEFYLQLAQTERFGMLRLTTPAKEAVRIVENLTFIPITKEVEEANEPVDILRRELTPDGLYKIWPKEPLPPGEYAVVEYSSVESTAGKLNIQVWDFAIKPSK
jgi:hypothetical protein